MQNIAKDVYHSGERSVRNAEVVGSIPIPSTKKADGTGSFPSAFYCLVICLKRGIDFVAEIKILFAISHPNIVRPSD